MVGEDTSPWRALNFKDYALAKIMEDAVETAALGRLLTSRSGAVAFCLRFLLNEQISVVVDCRTELSRSGKKSGEQRPIGSQLACNFL